MARIAYVDHSYHQRTLSSQFLPDIFRQRGHTVDFFWDDSWNDGKSVSFNKVLKYDTIIMFQSCCSPSAQYYARKHDNVIHIPMLDQFELHRGGAINSCNYWESFQGCKILSFSTAVHSIATFFGLCSFPIRYYQAPGSISNVPKDGLHGFFWLRHEWHLSWPMVRQLIGDTPFDSLHIHIAPDPNSPKPVLPTEEEKARYNITTSTWFEHKQDFMAVLKRANIFFAPRAAEGIGQSFLEALSRGQCVVASNNGTMNEYIMHGVNGLLYPWKAPAPLDFSRAQELGRAGLRSVEVGYARWLEQQDQLIDFILTPAPVLYKGLYRHAPLDGRKVEKKDSDPFAMIAPVIPFRQRLRQTWLLRKTERLWRPIWRTVKPFIAPDPS